MKYEERKQVISKWLFQFLRNYEVPTHLDDDATKLEMVNMVEDINSECPDCNENLLNLLLKKTAQYVRKNQRPLLAVVFITSLLGASGPFTYVARGGDASLT